MNLIYRSLITSVAALCLNTASADPLWEIVCGECRGTEHSQDFGNFALNQTYGPNSWLLQDEIIIYNLQGNWVHVDLSFELEGNILASLADLIGLDLGIPTGRIIIETTTNAITNDDYHVDLDIIDTLGPLPVGENTDSPPPGSSGGDSSGGGSTGGGGVGSGTGSGSGGAGGGGGNACTSAGSDWHCVAY